MRSGALVVVAFALALPVGCGRSDFGIASGDGSADDTAGTDTEDTVGDTSMTMTNGDTDTSPTVTITSPDTSVTDTSPTTVSDSDTMTTFPTTDSNSDSITTFTTTDSDSDSDSITDSDSDSDSDSDTDTGELCNTDPECASTDPCFVGSCEDGQCVLTVRDLDNDGESPPECGGQDCNDLNPNTFPGADEVCADGDDNDCNGVEDCFDPACEDVPNCGCSPSSEICDNGDDEDCDTAVDCNDADCQGTPACGCADGEDGLCVNGFDDDCDDDFDCDDADCAGDTACTCMSETEFCSDGGDDDCDLLIDCADPDCEGLFPCTCVGVPAPENCSDGIDNDCDELVDCADPQCAVSQACDDCSPEQCTGGDDEDCDGLIDCADEACVFDPNCAPQAEICNNDLDDDGDGAIDCDDDECFAVPVCQASQSNCGTAQSIFESGTFFGETTGNPNNTEGTCGGGAGEAVFRLVLFQPSHVVLDSVGSSFDTVLYMRAGSCAFGQELGCDDDSGGFMWSSRLDFTLLQPGIYFVFLDGYTIDPNFGPNEGEWQLNVEITEDPPEVCDDIIDNDGDVYADCGDPDCVAAPNCAGCVGGADPSAEFGVDNCTNGLDDDCDGASDCADEDCSASDFYVTECCDGEDENDNGIPDDFNCKCNNSNECGPGQMCYDHTADACGIPCTSFFGDVCPFVAPGSTCNEATDQCEF